MGPTKFRLNKVPIFVKTMTDAVSAFFNRLIYWIKIIFHVLAQGLQTSVADTVAVEMEGPWERVQTDGRR
jgi:hypothetical protein